MSPCFIERRRLRRRHATLMMLLRHYAIDFAAPPLFRCFRYIHMLPCYYAMMPLIIISPLEFFAADTLTR